MTKDGATKATAPLTSSGHTVVVSVCCEMGTQLMTEQSMAVEDDTPAVSAVAGSAPLETIMLVDDWGMTGPRPGC